MHSSRLVLFLTTLAALSLGLASCGGGGGSSQTPSPPPPAPTVTVSASPTEVASGSSSTLTITTSNATSCSMSSGGGSSHSVTCNGSVTVSPTANTTYTVTATGDGGSASASATVTVKLAISVAASSSSLNTGDSANLTATAAGGDGNATIAWSANPSVGSFSPATGTSTTWTAPTTLTASPETVTLTATATDGTGSSAQTAAATVTVTVTRVITFGINQPNEEFYSDFGGLYVVTMTCTGCESGDTLYAQSPNLVNDGAVSFTVPATSSWSEPVNLTYNVPGPTKAWILGTDGITSNIVWTLTDGSENIAAENAVSGEMYYVYTGNATEGSNYTYQFKQDGTADGTLTWTTSSWSAQWEGSSIAVDNKTGNILFGDVGGVSIASPSGSEVGVVSIPNSSSSAEVLAVSAKDGLGCAVQPSIDLASCFVIPTSISQAAQPFPLPGMPVGSEPAAVKVLDADDVVVFTRGDSTLRWYTISGTTATAAGTLQLSGFTNADAAYWKQYPTTGGWDLAEVGSTLAVMGQVVNGDGTVSQKLALVNATTQKLTQYVDLPAGTIHIAADATNNAVVAEYPDFTVSPPITRFKRIYVDTGNSTDLGSTSALIPGAGFLVTNDGSHIAVCDGGKCDFQPNQ